MKDAEGERISQATFSSRYLPPPPPLHSCAINIASVLRILEESVVVVVSQGKGGLRSSSAIFLEKDLIQAGDARSLILFPSSRYEISPVTAPPAPLRGEKGGEKSINCD